MKRLIAGLTVLVVAALAAPQVWAQDPDPFHFGFFSPAALEGTFDASAGKLAFLALAAPRGCADTSDPTNCPRFVRVFFYNASCTRVDSTVVSLSEGGAAVLPIPGSTAATSGNVLVAKADPGVTTSVRADHALPSVVIGWLVQIDLNLGVARMNDLAFMSGDFGMGWSPYKPAAVVPPLPQDSGAFLVTLLFRCPTGVTLVNPAANNLLVGTFNTLGGDMLEAYSQGDRNRPIGEAYNAAATTINPNNIFGTAYSADGGTTAPSNFATSLTLNFFDLNENPLGTVTTTCQCRSEPRLNTLLGAAATQFTYLEIEGTGPTNFTGRNGGAFTGSWNVSTNVLGPAMNFSDTFWGAASRQFLGPTF